MGDKQQQNGRTLIKKQVSRLCLQIKFSQINTTWYESSLKKSPKSTESPKRQQTTALSNFKTLDLIEKEFKLITINEKYEESIQKIQRQLETQLIIMGKTKQLLKDKLFQFQTQWGLKEKRMRQMQARRRNMIDELKREVELMMRMDSDHRKQLFHSLEAKFERELKLINKQYKENKKQWKNKLRSIIQKMQKEEVHKQLKKDSQEVSFQEESNTISLKQLKECFYEHQKNFSSFSLQTQHKIVTLIQTFHTQQQQHKQKSSANFLTLLQGVQNLRQSIRSQLIMEQLKSEQNRQKLLLFFQTNVDKIKEQNEINNRKRSTSRTSNDKTKRYRFEIQGHL